MLTYDRIVAAVREGGVPFLLWKIRMRLITTYDKNLFFHSMPKGFPQGELSIETFVINEKDVTIAKRILAAYRKASIGEKQYVPQKSYADAWDDNKDVYHDDLLKILHSDDPRRLANYLSNMHRQKSTYGVSGSVTEFRRIKSSSYLRKKEVAVIKDVLASFAEALDIMPYETIVPYVKKKNIYTDPNLLVAEIENRLGIKIIPPKVEGGLFKLSLKEGALDFRDLWSLYAAWRIREAATINTSIGEIGGGLGKVAVYADRFGFRNYSIFDLPIMNVMTAWHLIKALPDAYIVLYGEPDREKTIRILPYWEFTNKKFNLVINQDSFPEMTKEIVEKYLYDIKQNSKYLLNINHEHQAPLFPGADYNNLVVPKIIKRVGGFKRVYRFPCWIRKGYVEELYEIVP